MALTFEPVAQEWDRAARRIVRRVAVAPHLVVLGATPDIASLSLTEDVGSVVPTQGRGVLTSSWPMFGVVVGVVTCFERFS